jgi:polyferredoxin
MLYRLSPIILFAIALWALVWNAWFRPSSYGDAVVGEAYLGLYFTGAVLIATLLVILLPGYRSQDRYWGYVTLGMLIGFWMQR